MGLKHLAVKILGPSQLNEVAMVYRVIGDRPGVMIDVGAHHGLSLDPFRANNWTVFPFEPDPANRSILQARHPDLTIDNRAVSLTDGDTVDLFTSDVSAGISTLSPFHSSHRPTATVYTVRLDTFIRENSVEQVDFLKIDIEGHDLFALKSFPWETHHPRAVVCEYEDNKTERLGHNVHDIAKYLEGKGYTVLVSEWLPIVEYGGNHKWRRFLTYPAEISPQGWGNLIAVEPNLMSRLQHVGDQAARRLQVRHLVDSVRH